MSASSLIPFFRHLIDKTEQIFMQFAIDNQNLMKGAEESISASSRAIKKVKDSGTSSHMSGKNEAYSGLTNAFAAIQDQEDYFNSIHSEDDHFFSDIDKGMELIHFLVHDVDKIKDDSEEMWMIALNAMIAGVNAGKAGGVFSVITGEFKKKSMQTLGVMEDIVHQSLFIEEKLHTFKDLVEKARLAQHQFIKKLTTELKEGIESFNHELQDSLHSFQSLVEQVKEIRTPIHAIMEEIQHQDIVRQSVDQLILSITEMEKNVQSTEDQVSDQLNRLTFRSILSGICVSLLEDIKCQISENLAVFKDRSQALRTFILTVEQERKQCLANGESITASCDISIQNLQESARDMENLLRMKIVVKTLSDALMKEVTTLVDQFAYFAGLVRNYKNMNILYRIEVEKQSAFRSMRGNVRQMAELTSKMQEDIERMYTTTKKFISVMDGAGKQYDQIYALEEIFLHGFNRSIYKMIDHLGFSWESLILSIKGFSVFTKNFFDSFEGTIKDIDSLNDIIDEIERIKPLLYQIHVQSEQTLNDMLSGHQLDGWKITDERMNKIIKRFTIHRHKKKAGAMVDLTIEEGVEAGVVTLF